MASSQEVGQAEGSTDVLQEMCCRGPHPASSLARAVQTLGAQDKSCRLEGSKSRAETSAVALSQQRHVRHSVSFRGIAHGCAARAASNVSAVCLWQTPQGVLRRRLPALAAAYSAHVHFLGSASGRGLCEPEAEEALLAGRCRALQLRRQRRRRGRCVHPRLDGFGGGFTAGNARGVHTGLGEWDLALQARTRLKAKA